LTRTCGLKIGWRLFFGLGGLAFAAAAYFSYQSGLVWGAPFFAGFAALMWNLLRVRVEFDEERVGVFNGFRTRTIARAQVQGRRWRLYNNGVRELLLVSDVPGEKPLQMPSTVELASELQAWIEGLPDLDARERAEANQRAVEQFGADVLARRRTVARRLIYASIACGLWVWLAPTPYHAAMLANLALFAVAFALTLGSRGGYALDADKKEARPTLLLPLLFSGVAVAVRMVFDVHLLSFAQPFAFALAGGGAIAGLLMLSDPRERKRPWRFLLFAPLLSGLPFGALLYANAALEPAPPQSYSARILSKHVSHGRSTTWSVRLEPWGPLDRPKSEDVGRAFYERVRPGDRVRIRLYSGRLGIAWFEMDAP
jgi:hypothetical protein